MIIKCEICGKEFDARTPHYIHCPECHQWIKLGCTNSPKPSKKIPDGMKKLIADSRSADAAGLSYGEYMARKYDAVVARQRVRKERTATK